jgi:DNA-binding transcriptional LysR family regulator
MEFRSKPNKVTFTSAVTCNLADTAIEACVDGLGLGSFLSYMVAPLMREGKLRYVLEEFEVEPLPVHFLCPHSCYSLRRCRSGRLALRRRF